MMLSNISERDSEEYGVLILQPLEVRVFNSVYDFVIEGLIHCYRILVHYLYFFMLKLDLLS